MKQYETEHKQKTTNNITILEICLNSRMVLSSEVGVDQTAGKLLLFSIRSERDTFHSREIHSPSLLLSLLLFSSALPSSPLLSCLFLSSAVPSSFLLSPPSSDLPPSSPLPFFFLLSRPLFSLPLLSFELLSPPLLSSSLLLYLSSSSFSSISFSSFLSFALSLFLGLSFIHCIISLCFLSLLSIFPYVSLLPFSFPLFPYLFLFFPFYLFAIIFSLMYLSISVSWESCGH